MSIPNDVFHCVIVQEALLSQVFSYSINNILKRGERYRNVIFVGFTFFGDSFRNAFTKSPHRCELSWRL